MFLKQPVTREIRIRGKRGEPCRKKGSQFAWLASMKSIVEETMKASIFLTSISKCKANRAMIASVSPMQDDEATWEYVTTIFHEETQHSENNSRLPSKNVAGRYLFHVSKIAHAPQWVAGKHTRTRIFYNCETSGQISREFCNISRNSTEDGRQRSFWEQDAKRGKTYIQYEKSKSLNTYRTKTVWNGGASLKNVMITSQKTR